MSLCVTGLSSGKVAMLGGVWVLCGQYGMLGSPCLAGSSNELVLHILESIEWEYTSNEPVLLESIKWEYI